MHDLAKRNIPSDSAETVALHNMMHHTNEALARLTHDNMAMARVTTTLKSKGKSRGDTEKMSQTRNTRKKMNELRLRRTTQKTWIRAMNIIKE